MAIDIETSRNNGAMRTETNGTSSPGGVSYPTVFGFLAKAIDRKNRLAAMDSGPQRAESGNIQEPHGQYVPSLAASPTETIKKKEPVTRMRRVRARTPLPVYGIDPAGITYNDVQETLLDDGSWSGDALYGTNAGNEAAAMKGPMDITKLVGMNFSGLGGGTWGLPPKKES